MHQGRRLSSRNRPFSRDTSRHCSKTRTEILASLSALPSPPRRPLQQQQHPQRQAGTALPVAQNQSLPTTAAWWDPWVRVGSACLVSRKSWRRWKAVLQRTSRRSLLVSAEESVSIAMTVVLKAEATQESTRLGNAPGTPSSTSTASTVPNEALHNFVSPSRTATSDSFGIQTETAQFQGLLAKSSTPASGAASKTGASATPAERK